MNMMVSANPIVAEQVRENKRLSFLPGLVGSHYLEFEQTVYAWSRRLCSLYDGGFWDYYKLSTGTGFMQPAGTKQFDVVSPNGSSETMDAEAFGITVSLFALCQIANRHEARFVADRYHRLRDFAVLHPAWPQIASIID